LSTTHFTLDFFLGAIERDQVSEARTERAGRSGGWKVQSSPRILIPWTVTILSRMEYIDVVCVGSVSWSINQFDINIDINIDRQHTYLKMFFISILFSNATIIMSAESVPDSPTIKHLNSQRRLKN